MKNLVNFISYALIIFLGVFVSMNLCSCSEDYSEGNRIIDQDPSKEDPTPNTPTDTTKVDPYAWKDIVAKELNVDEDRQVESKIIAQRNNGDKDSIILRYILGFEISAPDTIRLTQPGTEMTAYTGTLSFPGKEYMPTKWENCDSAVVVTTTKGYKTNHYNVTWKTSHVNGWILFKGHMEPYKNSEETTTFTQPSLYKDAYEIVRNDSVYLREEVKHKVDMSFKNRTFSFEKKVVVDHFLRIKEGEKKEEKKEETAEFNTPGFTELLAYVRVHDVDKKQWNDAILLETKEAYYVVNMPFSYDSKDKKETYLGKKYITKYDKASIGKVSVKLNGVICVKGVFYPAYIAEDASGWYGVWSSSIDQSVDMNEATASGLKNQPKNGNAKGSCFVEKAVSKSTSGNILSVTGKTIGHTITTTFKIK